MPPVAQDNETLVDLSFCGICGSAWHGKDERRIPPLVLGHEAVGRAMDGPHAGRLVANQPVDAVRNLSGLQLWG